jgi:hypothetical protein
MTPFPYASLCFPIPLSSPPVSALFSSCLLSPFHVSTKTIYKKLASAEIQTKYLLETELTDESQAFRETKPTP